MKSGGISKDQNRTIGGVNAPLWLVLSAALLVGLLAPTPTLGGVDKKVMDICNKSTDAAFKAKYCSAAKDLKSGYNANIATSAVWTGVSVACGAACGKAVANLACKIASSGGSAGEGVLTKKFADSILGEGSKWGGEALNRNSGATAADHGAQIATAKGGVNAEACQTAGTSALKAYGKFSDSKTTEKSLTNLRDQTKDMNTPIAQKQVRYGAGNTQTPEDPNGANQSAATAGSEICSDGAITTALGAIRCAASRDSSLPPYVKSEEFVKDLQKATGKSADAFFANFESPAKSIFDSPLATGLPEVQQKGLADSLSAMEGYSDSKAAAKLAANGPSAAGYDSAGGAKQVADEDTGFDMNGMIAGILGQAGGAADGESAAAASVGGHLGVDRKIAGNVHAAEDRSISIFDRIQSRYGVISVRDHLGVEQ